MHATQISERIILCNPKTFASLNFNLNFCATQNHCITIQHITFATQTMQSKLCNSNYATQTMQQPIKTIIFTTQTKISTIESLRSATQTKPLQLKTISMQQK